MRCGSYPIFIWFTFFRSTLGPNSNTTLFPHDFIFEVHLSSIILLAQQRSTLKSLTCTWVFSFNVTLTLIENHLLSSIFIITIFFLSQIVIQIANPALIYNRGKKGGLPKWFPPAKNETHMRPLPIYWFVGIMFLSFATCDLLDKLMIALLFEFYDNWILMRMESECSYVFCIIVAVTIIFKSKIQTVSRKSLLIDNLAILELWKIEIIFSSKKSLH